LSIPFLGPSTYCWLPPDLDYPTRLRNAKPGYQTNEGGTKSAAAMKIFYIGVRVHGLEEHCETCPSLGLTNVSQILRNETRPAVELCGERDLSSFSRFTRDRLVEGRQSPTHVQLRPLSQR
jgi:hypothetical protein